MICEKWANERTNADSHILSSKQQSYGKIIDSIHKSMIGNEQKNERTNADS